MNSVIVRKSACPPVSLYSTVCPSLRSIHSSICLPACLSVCFWGIHLSNYLPRSVPVYIVLTNLPECLYVRPSIYSPSCLSVGLPSVRPTICRSACNFFFLSVCPFLLPCLPVSRCVCLSKRYLQPLPLTSAVVTIKYNPISVNQVQIPPESHWQQQLVKTFQLPVKTAPPPP